MDQVLKELSLKVDQVKRNHSTLLTRTLVYTTDRIPTFSEETPWQ